MMTRNQKCALAALSLLLALSVAGNVALLKVATSFYARILAVRLDPLGNTDRSWGEVDESNLRPRLLIVGDSRAAQWSPPSDFQGHTVLNVGIGNQTTAQILGRLDGDLSRAKPDIVLIQAGVNDLKALPLFPERRDAIVASCKTNLTSIVAKCAQAECRVIISTVFPVGTPALARRLVWSTDIANGVGEVNYFLRSLATTSVTVLDAYSLLSGNKGLIMPQYSADTLHLNHAGYEILNNELGKHLEEAEGSAQQGNKLCATRSRF